VKRASGKSLTVTMRDVAQSSGFSPATVSIVLNNAPLARYIAPATKKRIEDVAKKTRLPAECDGAFLRSKRKPQRRVMFFDIADPFCTPVLRGIENALYQSSTYRYSRMRTTRETASNATWNCSRASR